MDEDRIVTLLERILAELTAIREDRERRTATEAERWQNSPWSNLWPAHWRDR